jgi:hypothetical protein
MKRGSRESEARVSSPATTRLAKGCGTGILPVFHGRDAHATRGKASLTSLANRSGVRRQAVFRATPLFEHDCGGRTTRKTVPRPAHSAALVTALQIPQTDASKTMTFHHGRGSCGVKTSHLNASLIISLSAQQVVERLFLFPSSPARHVTNRVRSPCRVARMFRAHKTKNACACRFVRH